MCCQQCADQTELCVAAGSGRRVGENCEQLWAQMRPLYKLTRYMTDHAYLGTLDDALVLVADGKMQGCVDSMKQQRDAMQRKLSKWTGWIACLGGGQVCIVWHMSMRLGEHHCCLTTAYHSSQYNITQMHAT
jgi:hypothetical protein